jgi:hypothetical protein
MNASQQPDIHVSIAGTNGFRYGTDDLPLAVKAIRYYLPMEIYRQRNAALALYHYCCYVYPTNALTAVGYCAAACPGHSDREEARQHYREYLLDHYAQFNGKLSSPSVCSICGEKTATDAWVQFNRRWELAVLCNTHMNRESLAKVFVLTDYHLLQVSDVQSDIVATFTEHDGAISVIKPDFISRASYDRPFSGSDSLPPPCI